MLWDMLLKHLKFKTYKLQLVQALTEPDKALHSFLTVNMVELRERIIGAFGAVTGDMLIQVSEEMEYQWNISCQDGYTY